MTNQQLKKLETDLWDAANALRAYGGIKAADYAAPILGLIFLRFADNKYSHVEQEILAEYEAEKGTRLEREIHQIALDKCGFYLPDHARYDYLLHLSGDKNMGEALSEAMEGIEQYQDEKFKNVLPKAIFFELGKLKNDILPKLLKRFSDIPKDASGDVFGKIYEYFLGEFAMSEGQKGGEFFTPTSVVRFIVEVIEPYQGKIYDPACGSGGMFVQSAKFIQEAKHDLSDIYVCGQEYMGETVRLAKMNLLVNNIRGEITETNSYESDPYASLGKFDFVMANPPFNVKSVKESTVKNDERFYKYGLPKNKGKNTEDSITDANYLWVSLFATSLNASGRAGFVMPNSASDAGNSEYDIRKKIVDSGIVDCMVSMPSNMFFTVTLPATLWFFDKQKINSERKDKILFLDARNVFTQIDRAHREWSPEQINNLTAILRLYRGENERYLLQIDEYGRAAEQAAAELPNVLEMLQNKLENAIENLKRYELETSEKRKIEAQNLLETQDCIQKIGALKFEKTTLPAFEPNQEFSTFGINEDTAFFISKIKNCDLLLKEKKEEIIAIWANADKLLKVKADKKWTEYGLQNLSKNIDELFQNWKNACDAVTYCYTNIEWLQTRFPDAIYRDVVGLCKIADKTEYAEEQDYSLNAGRYVGVEIEDDKITKEEFLEKFDNQLLSFNELCKKANELEISILNSKKYFKNV